MICEKLNSENNNDQIAIEMRCRQEKKENAGLAKIKYFSVEHLPRGTLDSYLHLYIYYYCCRFDACELEPD